MADSRKSSRFTSTLESPHGPPLIGALLRMAVDAVHRRMFERLHERGFTDIDPAHLVVFQWPGPDDSRPSELAARLQISKQALNYLLGQLEQLGYLERRPDPHDQRGKRIAVTKRGRAARLQALRTAEDAPPHPQRAHTGRLTRGRRRLAPRSARCCCGLRPR